LALLAIGLIVRHRPAPGRAAAAYLLLVGLGSTLSRAGVIALTAGLVILALVSGVPATAARAAPLLLGAGVAVAALAPSFPARSLPHPGVAFVGLIAGGLIAVGGDLFPALIGRPVPMTARRIAFAALLAVAGAALWTVAGSAPAGTVLSSRGYLESFGRSGALRAAWGLIAAHPLVGTGVGVARFSWDDPVYGAAVATYAHDEYLQTVVDLGAVGAVLLLAVLGALAGLVWRGRPPRRGSTPPARIGLWAGAFAAVTALAVHSGFDFLWHLSVLPLLGGLLVGLATPEPAAIRPVATGGVPVLAGPYEV
jgi:hypothetical protein